MNWPHWNQLKFLGKSEFRLILLSSRFDVFSILMHIEDAVLLPTWLNYSQITVTNETIEFSYVGRVIPIFLQQGKYKFEAYGASGGGGTSSSTSAKLEDASDCINPAIIQQYGGNAQCNLISSTSGAGGYISGIISFLFPVKLYLYIGGHGSYGINSQPGGFNGGGSTFSDPTYAAGGGGGSTDFRLFSDSLFHRILVAGGGGGSDSDSTQDPGQTDDGSGGAGGIPSQGAWRDGTYYSEYSTNSTYGFTFGQGQKGIGGGAEGAGAGGGFFGGFGVPNSNAGASGGSSFALTKDIPIPEGYIEAKDEEGTVKSRQRYAFTNSSPFIFTDVKNATGIRVGNGLAKITLIEHYLPLPIHQITCHYFSIQHFSQYLLCSLFITFK